MSTYRRLIIAAVALVAVGIAPAPAAGAAGAVPPAPRVIRQHHYMSLDGVCMVARRHRVVWSVAVPWPRVVVTRWTRWRLHEVACRG